MVKAWWYISNNFGDNLNHFLIKAISGQPVVYTERDQPHNIVCGSILHECNEHSTVWGAGFGNKDQCLNTDKANIVAVRGELSRHMLGLDIPVGDPALLLPLYYYPKREIKHGIGIIPHYSDYGRHVDMAHHIIDPFQSTKDFIDDVLSCEVVCSSSLHGLIVADAYGVPNTWIKCEGIDEFKYLDYYSTTDRAKVMSAGEPFVSKYKHSLTELLNVCPFYGR